LTKRKDRGGARVDLDYIEGEDYYILKQIGETVKPENEIKEVRKYIPAYY
jgi:hypothetical protein